MRFARSSSVRLGKDLRGIAYFPMSRSIGQALPYDAPNDAIGALDIINAECDPLVVAEIELGEIPLQVLLADVMIDSVDTALQDREIPFNGIGVRIAANIFFGGMVDGLVTGEALVGFQVDSALIGAQVRLWETLKNSAAPIPDHGKSIAWPLLQLRFRHFSVCPLRKSVL